MVILWLMTGWDGTQEFDWEELDDVTSLSEEGLRGLLESLSVQEREISYHRRVLQGRIDLIRSELVRRGKVVLSPEELARVLMDTSTGDAPDDLKGRPS